MTDRVAGVGPVVRPRGRPDRTPAGGVPGEPLTDFGRQVAGTPAVVYRPRSSRASVLAVREAVADGRPVVARGRGHTVDGQTVGHGAALVDLSRTRRVRQVSTTQVSADAGATWRDVLDATLPVGALPPVVPDFLDLTVGGTLSVGGISGVSHRYGTAADHVLGATVVDPGGREHRVVRGDALLDRVLAGQGNHGVLVAATLALRPAPRRVRRADIVTPTLADHVDVQRRLLATGAVHWLDGSAVRSRDGALVFTSRLAQPDDAEGVPLVPDREGGWTDLRDFLARADALVRGERASGRWARDAHPRLQTLLPLAPGVRLLADLLARGAAELLGPGGTLMISVTTAAALRRLGARGDADGNALVVGWQRTAPAGDDAALARMQEANRRIRALTARSGGVLYAAGRACPAGSADGGARQEVPGPGTG